MAISTEYRQYLQSDQWDARRREALHQAGYRCELCSAAKPLQVHHLTYERIFNERANDLQAVCDRCHRRLHGIRPWWIRVLGILWRGIKRMASDIKDYQRIECHWIILADSISKRDKANK